MEEEFQLGFLVRRPISFSVLYRHEPWQLSYPCWLTCTLLHHTTTPIHLSHLSLPHGSFYPEDTLSEKVFLVSLCSKQCCFVVTNVTVVLPRPFCSWQLPGLLGESQTELGIDSVFREKYRACLFSTSSESGSQLEVTKSA